MKKILYPVVALILVVILVYSFFGGDDEKRYIKEIEAKRQETETFMKSDEESPFVLASEEFLGLRHYDPKPEYKVRAELDIFDNNTLIALATSDGKEKFYEKYAQAHFTLSGARYQLTVLKPAESNDYLFIPFSDETSAITTYGGGRYLELPFTKESNIEIDFNTAYNPYCAYVATFSCPFPPAENHLQVEIEAGEKIYHR